MLRLNLGDLLTWRSTSLRQPDRRLPSCGASPITGSACTAAEAPVSLTWINVRRQAALPFSQSRGSRDRIRGPWCLWGPTVRHQERSLPRFPAPPASRSCEASPECPWPRVVRSSALGPYVPSRDYW
jgi:hypothetical protein